MLLDTKLNQTMQHSDDLTVKSLKIVIRLNTIQIDARIFEVEREDELNRLAQIKIVGCN